MAGNQLLDYCQEHRDWLRAEIEALVQRESPSTNKTAVDRCGDHLTARLTAVGGAVERLDQPQRGNHVRSQFAGSGRPVLLLGHFDTVWDVGQLARMPLREEDGRLHGPGIFDMKAGIGVAMLAMRALRDLRIDGVPPVVMLWTTDEEIGSGTSRAAIEEEARRSAAVLVLEPSLPGGAAKTSRKGVGEFTIEVHGVSAHAGIDPAKGVSAIQELAHQILEIAGLQDLPRGISLNVGVIEGGTRTNVVASRAVAHVDLRVPTMEEATRIEAAVRQLQPRLAGTRLQISGGVNRPPLERGPHVIRLYEQAKIAAAELGRDLGEGSTGGGSDGNFTAALGVPTLDGLGPMGDGAHALHEHVVMDDLPWRAAFVAALIARLGTVQW